MENLIPITVLVILMGIIAYCIYKMNQMFKP